MTMTNRACADLDQIPGALAKTGFLLEYEVAETFKKSGWSTIGGRYYADDVDGRARELDLIAYRTEKQKEVEVVTAVLVSCKKDAETTWTFLSKDRPRQDPNFDWDPVHYWTDVQPLQSFLSSASWKSGYIEALGDLYKQVFQAKRDVFAFQQIGSSNVVPRNDKAIFDSIVTLMKALDHEVDVVPARAKNRGRLYVFSLLSVVDAPLVDAQFKNGAIAAKEVESITHLARYMVKRRELSALIHVVRSDCLPAFVTSLSKLARINTEHMNSLIDASYSSIKSNEKVRAYFAARMKARILWRLDSALSMSRFKNHKVTELSLAFNGDVLNIEIDIFDDGPLGVLNTHQETLTATAKALKDIARYEGSFKFVEDIPF